MVEHNKALSAKITAFKKGLNFTQTLVVFGLSGRSLYGGLYIHTENAEKNYSEPIICLRVMSR